MILKIQDESQVFPSDYNSDKNHLDVRERKTVVKAYIIECNHVHGSISEVAQLNRSNLFDYSSKKDNGSF